MHFRALQGSFLTEFGVLGHLLSSLSRAQTLNILFGIYSNLADLMRITKCQLWFLVATVGVLPLVLTSSADELPANRVSEFWSLQPITDPSLPRVRQENWVQSPIDRFILSKLEERNLTPAEAADRRTLIRRVTYDLIGLPPTPAEVEAFVHDSAPDAFDKVVERLLASPAYGEHWGRHWLDVVRYADTAGCNSDFPVPAAYKYRNWVIDALNEDKPYDAFLREQIAGDLLPASSEEDREKKIIATGYLAIARRFASNTNEFHLTLDDAIDNLGKSVLGLSLSCARCHDHKYDPVPAEDYFALYGILSSSTFTFPGVELYPTPRDYVPLGSQEQRDAWRKWESDLTELELEYRRLERLTRGNQRQENDIEKIRAEMENIKKRKAELRANPPRVELAYAVTEGKPADAKVHLKGDPKSLGDPVRRGFLRVLGGQKLPEDFPESGRRQLAEWLTDPTNPLTARVMANRIWQWHFGKGIVSTPNDFGRRGERPTHPELLDWLASRFVESGWSIKTLHRLILLSSTYQMNGEFHADKAARDPENELLWRFERRRLSAEEIRDTLLFVSGSLEIARAGPHPFPPMGTWSFTQHRPFVDSYETSHRSVYLMQSRIRRHPFLELFDGADPNAATGRREASTTPVQALFTMNAPLVHELSRTLAQRLHDEWSNEPERIDGAHRLLFARPATSDELEAGSQYLAEVRLALKDGETPDNDLELLAWASYCRVLCGSNEFFFLD